MTEICDKDFQFITIEEAINPTKGNYFQMYLNYWWAVCPGKGLMLYNPVGRPVKINLTNEGTEVQERRRQRFGSPQCNMHYSIVKRVSDGYDFEIQVRKFPRIFIPIDPVDYA